MHGRNAADDAETGPLVVGVTGTIGAGKSTLARLLAERGAAVVDADALASAALARPEVRREIAEAFGDAVLDAEGQVDRSALAQRVFGDDAARQRLEAIVHPRVAQEREAAERRLRQRSEPPAMIVHDVPLLFEVGLDDRMDVTVTVDASPERRRARLAQRSGLSDEEVRRREGAQWSAARKRAAADLVVVNDADEEALRAQVALLWPRLLAYQRSAQDGVTNGSE